MEITKDDRFSAWLLAEIYKSFTEGREDRSGTWHVSDLMFPRYAVLQKLEGTVIPTAQDVGFFFTGEAYHRMLQKVMGEHDSEKRVEAYGILGSIDFFDGDLLIEIKTSRQWTVPEEPKEHYIEQVGYYAAITGKKTVRIILILPTAGRKWDGSESSTVELRTWTVVFTDEELATIAAHMIELKTSMEAALVSFDLTTLPMCPEWKYGSLRQDPETKKWEVKARCPFAHICRCQEEKLQAEADLKNSRVGSRGGKRGF